jgi:hypothetical protein
MSNEPVYIIKYGNKYATNSTDVEKADATVDEMRQSISKYLDSVKDKFLDANGNLPEDWDKTIFWHCTEESNGLGSQLEPCPFCKRNMIFMREMHRNKYGRDTISQYYLHTESNSSDCLLDELWMPFSIGAGDADISENQIGEYATKWNKQLGKEG